MPRNAHACCIGMYCTSDFCTILHSWLLCATFVHYYKADFCALLHSWLVYTTTQLTYVHFFVNYCTADFCKLLHRNQPPSWLRCHTRVLHRSQLTGRHHRPTFPLDYGRPAHCWKTVQDGDHHHLFRVALQIPWSSRAWFRVPASPLLVNYLLSAPMSLFYKTSNH